MMGITQGIADIFILKVGSVAIMHGLAFEYWEDANRLQCFAATFPVRRIIGQESSANHVQPPQLAFYAAAGLIEMPGVFRFSQCSLGELVNWRHLLGYLLAGFHDCSFAHHLTIQSFQDICCSFQRYKVILVEVHHLRLDPFTILHWLTDPDWKFAHRQAMTCWTGLDLRLMLRDFYFHRRYVKYLPLLASLRFHFFQVRMAVTTTPHSMGLHVIRSGDCLERVPSMTVLPAAFLATFLSQAFGLLLQSIARWRFAAVAAVLSNLIFQALDALCQLAKCLMEECDDSFFALVICSADLFIACQTEWLHTYIVLGFYVFDNVKVLSFQAFYA